MKGICFIEPLFHLIISGKKTQTRRICRHQYWSFSELVNAKNKHYVGSHTRPRYRIGETVYLKEPYWIDEDLHRYDQVTNYKYSCDVNDPAIRWKNKLFMSSKYARHFIKMTDTRVECLQDISDDDCIAEGIIPVETDNGVVYQWRETIGPRSAWCKTPQSAYACLIDSIAGVGTWDKNPYIDAYTFELFTPY